VAGAVSASYLRVATEDELAGVDEVQRENRWLGYEPAGEEAVRAAEERLGVRLPPSYRNFLLTSNGATGSIPSRTPASVRRLAYR
jgi:hypothetical protein